VAGVGQAQNTAIGNLPTPDALDLSGLQLSAADLAALIAVDVPGWRREVEDIAANYARFGGDHLPKALHDQLETLRKRLG
jgi:phosphoenolpyruvate carboxykinase (GTP)